MLSLIAVASRSLSSSNLASSTSVASSQPAVDPGASAVHGAGVVRLRLPQEAQKRNPDRNIPEPGECPLELRSLVDN
jgi:hypothetical protein